MFIRIDIEKGTFAPKYENETDFFEARPVNKIHAVLYFCLYQVLNFSAATYDEVGMYETAGTSHTIEGRALHMFIFSNV